MSSRSFRVAGLAAVALAVLAVFLLARSSSSHEIVLKAYFADAMGLRSGAPVRLAGVDIGTVKTVRARPESKEAPAEVVMVLHPVYDLKIPSDSTASLATAGVLGPTYVEISVEQASGPPIGPDAVLKTTSPAQVTTKELLDKLSEALSRKCDCDTGKKDNRKTEERKESEKPRKPR